MVYTIFTIELMNGVNVNVKVPTDIPLRDFIKQYYLDIPDGYTIFDIDGEEIAIKRSQIYVIRQMKD